MIFTDELIQEVKDKTDIVKIISRYTTLHKEGEEYIGYCPFHKESTPSFHVYPKDKSFKCFGCGETGDVFTFLMKAENMEFDEVMARLSRACNVKLPPRYTEEENMRYDALMDINERACTYYREMARKSLAALGYIRQRGLDNTTLKNFSIGFCPENSNLYQMLKKDYDDATLRESGLFIINERGAIDKFAGRLIFPIKDKDGNIIAFGGRIIKNDPDAAKYINSYDSLVYSKSHNLFALDVAKNTSRNYLLLCEGYMDAISLHQAGFDNAIASLGTALTKEQASLIARHTDEVILTQDSDEAGIKAILRSIPLLRENNIVVKVLDMSPYKDPDEFIKNEGRDAFQERIDKAVPAFLFELKQKAKDLNLDNPLVKKEFFNKVVRCLAEEVKKDKRQMCIDILHDEYGFKKESIIRQMKIEDMYTR